MKNRKMIPLLCALLALALMSAACRKSAPVSGDPTVPDASAQIEPSDPENPGVPQEPEEPKEPQEPDTPSYRPGPEEIPFSAQMIRTNGWHDDAVYPRLTYIGSADALNRYFEENQDDYDFSHRDTVYSDMTIGFVDAVAGYDEAFFADHALLLVLLEEGSGSVRHEVASVTREASGSAAEVTVEITRFVPEVGTDDMAEWHAVIEVPRTVEETDAFVVKMK